MAKIEAVSIRDAVIYALKSSKMFQTFAKNDPETKIYDNAVNQGFQDGCFFVKSNGFTRKHQLGNVYQHTERVEVRYYIPTGDREDIALKIAENLFDIMEYIQIDNEYFRGKDSEYIVVDRVLHFYTSYEFRIEKQEEFDTNVKMETLNENIKLGGNDE